MEGGKGSWSAQKTYAAKLGVELGLEARHLALHLWERGGRLGHVRGQGGLFLLQLGRRRARGGKEEDLGRDGGAGANTARQPTAELRGGGRQARHQGWAWPPKTHRPNLCTRRSRFARQHHEHEWFDGTPTKAKEAPHLALVNGTKSGQRQRPMPHPKEEESDVAANAQAGSSTRPVTRQKAPKQWQRPALEQ